MYHTSEKIIKNKVGLLNLAEELSNILKACKIMSFSRETFYRYKSAIDERGVRALLEITRRKPNLKNRVESETEQSILDFAVEYPAYGQARACNELRKKRDICIT
jgi:ACT domain-containing protein